MLRNCSRKTRRSSSSSRRRTSTAAAAATRRSFSAAAATLAPGNPAIFRLQANLHEAAADWGALEREAVAWRTAAPQDPAPWRALAKAQLQSGYPRLAMQSHRRAFELGGRSAEWLAIYGRVCLHALDHDAAEAAFAESEKLDPKNAAMLSGAAILKMWKGDFDAARAYCRRALDSNPRDATALKTLADLMDNRLPAADLAALQALADAPQAKLADRITRVVLARRLPRCGGPDRRGLRRLRARERPGRGAGAGREPSL